MSFLKWFNPAPHVSRLPDKDVKRVYPWRRWSVLESTFVGYATYYLLRNNMAVVAKDMQGALGYTKSDIGTIMAVTAATYGIGKFLMGALSDRSNPRKFMAVGLLLTGICNFAFGGSKGLGIHTLLWGLNGLFQGMGWPPCGRSMGHWFSERERGLTFSIWNTSHNLGGGIAGMVAAWAAGHFGGWQFAFFVPGVISIIGAAYIFWRLCDTPQSCGLPSIEEYKNDFTGAMLEQGTHETEFSFRELFVNYVLTNKFVWILAFANFFAYVSRYSMLDWGPMYLREMKGASLEGGGLAVLITEFGGIPSTILLGWISDKIGGRRGLVSTLCMIPIIGAFIVMLVAPAKMWLDMAMLAVIGFFVYPVINLIVIQALDLTSKKAIGTAAGFIGMFGYAGRVFETKAFGVALDRYSVLYGKAEAWDIVIRGIVGCSVAALVLLAITWTWKPRA